MTRDNIATWRTYADEEWGRMTAPDADPLTVEEPQPAELPRSRDGLLLALAVLVIVGLLGYAIGRAS